VWSPAWERLAKPTTAEVEPDPAWVVDDTGFPKRGSYSVAVARHYSGTFGRTGNCQVADSLQHVGKQETAALAWGLYVPEAWASDEQRRKDAGIWVVEDRHTLVLRRVRQHSAATLTRRRQHA